MFIRVDLNLFMGSLKVKYPLIRIFFRKALRHRRADKAQARISPSATTSFHNFHNPE